LEVQFTDESTNAASVHYNFGDGMETDTLNPVYWYTTYGTYEVSQIVENEQGCVDTIIKEIVVNTNENIFIPNSFTPNGDGKNDVFYPVQRGIQSKDFEFFVFNRWGQLIYQSNDPSQGWDGLQKGKEIKTGVYVWKLSYSSLESQETVQKLGHVTVLK
jgi:gliding motility-associated-like protein